MVQYAYERCTELNFDLKVGNETVSSENLQFGFGFKFHPENEDKVSLTINAEYFLDGKQVFSHSSEHIFKFKDRNKVFEFKDTEYCDKVGIMPILLGLAYSTARGMMVIRAAGTALAEYPAPIINPTEFLAKACRK